MGNLKQKWTAEEEALLAGIAKHGPGKWKNILRDPEFATFLVNRSNIDLKVLLITSLLFHLPLRLRLVPSGSVPDSVSIQTLLLGLIFPATFLANPSLSANWTCSAALFTWRHNAAL